MKSTTSWEPTQRKGWGMRGLPLTHILPFYKLLGCFFTVLGNTTIFCEWAVGFQGIPLQNCSRRRRGHYTLGALVRAPDEGEMSPPFSSFLSGKEVDQTAFFLTLHCISYNKKMDWVEVERWVIWENEEPQEVGQAGRKAPCQERRPTKLRGMYLDPKGIRGWKVLQNLKTFVLRKRGGNFRFPFSTLSTLPCFQDPKLRQVPWAL